MIQYHITNTSVPLELTVLSGGTTVTGLSPVVKIRHKDLGQYFDFASRTFTSVCVSATGVLLSAIDGVYRLAWDTSGLFVTSTFLTFEYHQATAVDMDDVYFTRRPLEPNDLPMGGGNIGNVTIKGQWTANEKEDLFDKVKEINNNLSDFRRRAMILLKDIVDKKFLKKEDLDFLIQFKEKGDFMWQEFLKIMKMNDDSTTKEVLEKLEQYKSMEEDAKVELLGILNTRLKKETKEEVDEDE